jgi:hypothetical protein
MKTNDVNINVSHAPSLGYRNATAETSSTEQQQNVSAIVSMHDLSDDKDIRSTTWIYEVDDPNERRVGLSIRKENLPQVRFGIQDFANRPQVGVGLLMTWSLPSSTPSSTGRLIDYWNRLKAKDPVPVFANFLQQISMSIRLDGLEGRCRIRDPMLLQPWTEPAPNSDGRLASAHDHDRAALNTQGRAVPDVEASSECALHGYLNSSGAQKVTGDWVTRGTI